MWACFFFWKFSLFVCYFLIALSTTLDYIRAVLERMSSDSGKKISTTCVFLWHASKQNVIITTSLQNTPARQLMHRQKRGNFIYFWDKMCTKPSNLFNATAKIYQSIQKLVWTCIVLKSEIGDGSSQLWHLWILFSTLNLQSKDQD